MSVLKSVSLSYILKKLSTLTCFCFLTGLGESYFLASVNAQQVLTEHVTQAKSDLSFSKSSPHAIDSETETVLASDSAAPATNAKESNSGEIESLAEIDELAEDSSESATSKSSKPSRNLEKQIIAELNRVRTNPGAYADWLESQKQHYQGMILNFPGEQSLRTNRGLRTLNEAIAFVRAQQPLPALSDSEDLLANAQDQVAAIINQQKIDHHINNLVYNRLTPEAIVMQLVVDDGFPDRRHRLAVFQEDYQQTGVVCQEIEIYQQVCAIAYEDRPLEIIQDSAGQVAHNQPSNSDTSGDNSSTVANSNTATDTNNNLPASSRTNGSEIVGNNLPSPPPGSAPEKIIETKTAAIANPPSASLPAPPAAPTELPSNDISSFSANPAQPPKPPEPTSSQPEATSDQGNQSAIATNPVPPEEAKTPENSTVATTPDPAPNGDEQVTSSAEKLGENIASSPQAEPQKTASETKAPETKPENTEIAAANTVKPAQVAEIVESGVLEEGDEVVPNDGSFYDSFPLEGSAGDSFSISLESQDFDTFLAVMDPEGNIIEKNDDINEQTSNSRLEVTLPESGSYSVIVNAYDKGGKGKYTLKVSE